jgi:hypothetical protein
MITVPPAGALPNRRPVYILQMYRLDTLERDIGQIHRRKPDGQRGRRRVGEM